MNKIIFINQETGPLLIDMINVFAKDKFEIFLYTGEVIKTYEDLDSNVKIRKLCKYKKSNPFYRISTWLIFFIQSLLYVLIDSNKYTKVWISTNPPIAPWINLFQNRESYIHVYDVYPNALLALPYIKKESLIYKLFLYLNKKSYKKSTHVFTPSYGMKKMLVDSIDQQKVKVIPWWADTEFIKPIDKNKNKFIDQHNLIDTFNVMYSGNLGSTHNIEKILETALFLKDDESIKFIIIGEGPKKRYVDKFQKRYKLTNLLILPFQSEKVLPYSLAAADISIVLDSFASNIDSGSTASIPSKTYYIMAAGSIIYAESDETSELNSLINLKNLGLCDSSKDIHNFVEFIKDCNLNESLRKTFQANSRESSFSFTKKNAQMLYDEIQKK